MPSAKKPDQVLVTCPLAAISSLIQRGLLHICKKCGEHFRVQEVLNPVGWTGRQLQLRRVTCFDCGAGLEVPVSAESSMCKWCSRYLDLHDYQITTPMAKNFRTRRIHNRAERQCLQLETIAADVVIRGKFHGRLTAEIP